MSTSTALQRQHTEAFEMVRRRPCSALAGSVAGLTGYREHASLHVAQREVASLVVPLILSFGTPFRIALGRQPQSRDTQPSFAAGLYAGPVLIESDGRAECLQIDFTPPGAYRFFGGVVHDLANRMVPLDLVLGADGRAMLDEVEEAAGWTRRFDIVEQFLLSRLAAGERPSTPVVFAYRDLVAGRRSVAALADEIGWSRKHFVARFSREIGMTTKSVSRIARLQRTCALARKEHALGWAEIAAAAGFADQSHMIRDFAELAGETPGAWKRRTLAADPRFSREPAADGAG
jgi:AraC-like DNA-binding protein